MNRTAAWRALVACLGLLFVSACTPQSIIEEFFDERSGPALEVARCESGLNPEAVSPGGGNHGLFQINSVHRENFERVTGRPWSDRYNAVYNTWYAWHLSVDGTNWRPWTCQP